MGRGQWVPCGAAGDSDREISNVVITITDNAAVAEGQAITAVCNGKTFSSTIKNGIAKMYTSEVGTYTITAGDYSTMLVCPYFGQFSTDIYSGVLKITCTEAGGNNKTCHVQSCDAEYNFTNDYNLTQTFDSSLGLTFMGIPAGKYLITVDDRYRFFKEITSIQNINTINVELKQWLYRDGDECPWNTGGWIQCQATYSGISLKADNYVVSQYSPYSSIQRLDKLANALRLYQKCVVTKKGGQSGLFAISKVYSYIFVGTKNSLSISANHYTKLVYASSGVDISIALRSGQANNTSTNTSTTTVIASGTAKEMNITSTDVPTYIVCGKSYANRCKGRDGDANWYDDHPDAADLNYESITDLTQVYLV